MKIKNLAFPLALAAAFFFAMVIPLQADAKSEIFLHRARIKSTVCRL
jgi:hypothetical protein